MNSVVRQSGIDAVGDNAREAMGTLLQIDGHEVECAHDGLSALDGAAAFKPDIDGYEAARRLRATPGGCHAKLIALTGYGQPDDLALAAAAGFDAHILKPAKMEDVLGKIAAFAIAQTLEAAPGLASGAWLV